VKQQTGRAGKCHGGSSWEVLEAVVTGLVRDGSAPLENRGRLSSHGF